MASIQQPYFPVTCILLIIGCAACTSDTTEPDIESDVYRQAVSDFYLSLAAGQTDEALFAFNKMNDVARQFPDEPAAWANLGVYAMRQGNYELAADRLSRARELAPDHPDILLLSGLLERRMGNLEQAISRFREGITAAPRDLRIRYALASELERQDDIHNAGEIMDLLQEMHEDHPDNLVVRYELIRYAAKLEDTDLLHTSLEDLDQYAADWPAEAGRQLDAVRTAVENEASGTISTEVAFLHHELEQLPRFRDQLNRMRPDPAEIGFLIPGFLWLPQPDTRAAEPDFGLNFTREVPEGIQPDVDYIISVTLLEDLPPKTIFGSNGRVHVDESIALEFPGTTDGMPLPPHSISEIDYNYNFLNDLAMAGNRGFRLYRQNSDLTFSDVTSELGLAQGIVNGSYQGIWVADVDMDGDLDLVLAPVEGNPVVLRNNGDDTFTSIDLFADAADVVDFMWVDLDSDGVPNAVFLDQNGELHIYENHRSGNMVKRNDLPVSSGIAAFTIADINADSYFNLLVLTQEFSLIRMEYQPAAEAWSHETIVEASAENTSAGLNFANGLYPGVSRLFAADFDNNGRLDLLATAEENSWIWLGNDQDQYDLLEVRLPGGINSVVDINGNDRLDLLGLRSDGVPYQLINSGTANYRAHTIRARASGTEGDGRINSFGIGGAIEIRSGLLYQKQLITSPIIHLGLGTYDDAEMLRIVWPNGSVQTEFAELGMGSTIFNEQILKGSCPWLFTYDGKEMQFITDILWRSPLGLRINAQETAGVIQTLDRVRIPGSMLKSRNGLYELRITAELWETHFFDHVSLVAVDHPEDTEIFIDERFVFPPPDLSTRLTGTPRPVARVLDDKGQNVTETVSRQDGNYLRTFEKTRYQGIVEDHYIVIELGDEPPSSGPLWLVASGWLRPTDSSINLAVSQASHPGPQGLRIEVADGSGDWTELHADYGIPAGKTKTILLDLEDVFADPSDRRIRMHTTSEIYWDAIQWAPGLPREMTHERELEAETMELRYRGYSEWNRADEVSPKLPDYSMISGTTPRWRDLIGFHTRFGDVSELLEDIDDRYVIMNAGDEIILRYVAPDEPEVGWTRSFVFVSDGWVKDGDYNTEASKTVHPLPFHGQTDYNYTPAADSEFRSDPVFLRHRYDWINFHTRFISPEAFESALVFDK